MKHEVITAPLRDTFGIGQLACARITAEVAQDAMDRAAKNAFRFDQYWPVQAAALDTIHACAAQKRHALAIIQKGEL